MANSNRLSAENGIYIDNYIEPDDGSIKFIDNAVVKYYEKKVYNLKRGSWESQTEVAVKNDQLYLIINNGRKYPDNFGFSKGISGYYVSFTINIDEEIMQQLSYYGISSAGTELVSGKLMERIEGFVKGISSVIPKDQRISYLKHLISKKGSKLALIHIGKGCAIQTVGFISLKNYICVYGYQSMTGSDAATQSHGKAVSIASHIDYNSSASVPYIEDFIEPKNGKMIFENGMVYTYFERKVYSLKGSWEKGTQEAIRHKQLFLIIDGIRRYPDHDGINRAPKGFYLPFTVVTANPPATQTKIGNKNTLSFSEEKNEALTDDFFHDESDIGNIFAEFGINRDNTADDLSFLSTEKTANSKGSTIKVKEEASKTKVDSSTSKPSPHPNSIPANISNSVSLSEIAHYNAGIQPTNYDTEIQRTRQTSTSSQEINTIAAENINKADNNIIAKSKSTTNIDTEKSSETSGDKRRNFSTIFGRKNLNANSEKPGKNTYIENNIEPEDYQISFANNSLYQKFERKVNNLSGSQEKVLEEAINNRDLFIIVDDVKRYPDNYRYQKTQRAYYVSFTLNIDAKQAQQIQYYEVKSAGKDDLQAYGKSVEKFEAKVRGLWSNVPTSSIELYMKKLINENVTLRYLVVGNSKKIEISNATVSDNIVRVYGYNLSEESSSSLSQLSVSSLHNEGCRNMSNPENAYERWVGRIIGIPENINLETWFATHRDSVYLKASINGVLLAPDHLEMSSSHPIVVYHAPIEEERLKSSIQSPADQAPNRADTDANGELPVLSSSSSTSSITSASSTTIKSQGKRISATVKKIKTAIGKTDKVTRNRSSSAVTGAVTTQAVDKAPPNDKLIKQPVVPAVTVSKEDMLTKEIRRLREQLLRLKWEKNNIPPVKETIKKIVLGQPYFLDGYKDMNDKLALLKEAIRSDDGNAILIITLFLKRTIRKDLFIHQLKDHPVATDQYLHYLKVASEHKDLIDMYSVLGRTQEFAALKYKLALVGGDPQVKIQNLEELKKEFKYDRQLSVFSAIVSQQCSLIKRQISIEAQDSVLISGESNEMLVKYPPTGSIFEHSLIKTLNYCAKYHSSLPQDHFSSPHSVHKENKLTERQFIMATVDAYVKTDQLQYIENFNKTKSKFFNFGSKSSTPNETILQALVSAKASEETATKYLKNIENVTARYDLAKRFRYHTIAVECLISLRNRDELEEYCTKIKRNSPAYSVAAQALVNPTIRWK